MPEHELQVKDFLGREVRIPFPPQRIVSLCPSQTELLFSLGLEKQVAGRTKWCVHPQPQIEAVREVGGTKDPDIGKIRALNPDLILCEKEENTEAVVAELARHFPVYVTDVRDLRSALEMIRAVGQITGTEGEAGALRQRIEAGFAQLHPLEKPLRAAYLIWRKPWMAAADDTYIGDMLKHLGFINVFSGAGRYPAFSLNELAGRQPDLILLPSEPFPFLERHIAELKQALSLSDDRFLRVDGEMFSWYGSRMEKAVGYFDKVNETCRRLSDV